MNKRHKAILAALQPATDAALRRPKHDRAPGLAMHKRPTADAAAELVIYGTIGGGGWFDEGIGATDVQSALQQAGPGPINVRLNSPGGDVFDGVAIHSLLARHPGTVTVFVDGLAASAASFIMLAGDRIVSARNAFVMIHSAMTMTYGNPKTHLDAAALLEKVSDNIADIYAERAGEDPAYWRNLMDINGEDGTWYTGQEALSIGLVDALTEVPDDYDEDARVAARLVGWSNRLPVQAREFISAHPVEDDDEEEETSGDGSDQGSGDLPEVAPSPEPEPTIITEDAVDDVAWAMLAAMIK